VLQKCSKKREIKILWIKLYNGGQRERERERERELCLYTPQAKAFEALFYHMI